MLVVLPSLSPSPSPLLCTLVLVDKRQAFALTNLSQLSCLSNHYRQHQTVQEDLYQTQSEVFNALTLKQRSHSHKRGGSDSTP